MQVDQGKESAEGKNSWLGFILFRDGKFESESEELRTKSEESKIVMFMGSSQ